jgi:hypothetical protein
LSFGLHTISLLKMHAKLRSLRMEGGAFLQFMI